MEVFYGEDGELYFSLSGKYGQLEARTWRPSSEETRQAIFDLRVRMNWSRAMLAAVLGVSTDVLRRWEDGRRNPCGSAQKLVWLMHALFLAPTELGNISNIVSWGHGIKALLVMNETELNMKNKLLLCAFILLVFGSTVFDAAHSAVIFESGTLGSTGEGGGIVIAEQCVGARFHLDSAVEVQAVGGHILGSPPFLDPHFRGPLFAALVLLSSPLGFPAGTPDTMPVIATTTFTPPFPSQDILTPLSANLPAGDYALIFGSYRFGATGEGAMTRNNTPIPGNASYFAWITTGTPGWYNNHPIDQGGRFVITGVVVPEPNTCVLLMLGLAGAGLITSRCRRQKHH